MNLEIYFGSSNFLMKDAKPIPAKITSRKIDIEINLDGVVESNKGILRILISAVIGPGTADRMKMMLAAVANLIKLFFHK